MFLKYFYDPALAQASYLIGCQATGEAMVVDPARSIQQYIDTAKANGLQITHITETHIHADFVSGSLELANATGGTIYLSAMGGSDWEYAYIHEENVIGLLDNDVFMIGNIKIQALHTPGHTPEHISFLVTDTANADQPIGIFTGDFLFVGDVGRPDLLEAAVGIVGSKEVGASQQFDSVQRIKTMPDYLQIWPGHGAGSACGKALGAIPSSTLGYEKLFNPAFQHEDRASFTLWLLDGQPEAPAYFAQMKKVNQAGPRFVPQNSLPKLELHEIHDLLEKGSMIFDFRNKPMYEANHIMGTISIPASNTDFITYVGWLVDYKKPIYFVTADDNVDSILERLHSIGVDNIGGRFTMLYDTPPFSALPIVKAQDIASMDAKIMDVRGQSEYNTIHIVGSQHVPLGTLPTALDDLDADAVYVLHCASSYRSKLRPVTYDQKVLTMSII